MSDRDWMGIVIAAVAEETGVDPATLEPMTTAADVEGWDSLAHVRIVLNIEMRAGMTVDVDMTYGAATLADLVDLLDAMAGE